MHVITRAPSRHVTTKNEYAHGHDKQRADRARAAIMPACDSRPRMELYSDTSRFISTPTKGPELSSSLFLVVSNML